MALKAAENASSVVSMKSAAYDFDGRVPLLLPQLREAGKCPSLCIATLSCAQAAKVVATVGGSTWHAAGDPEMAR